MDITLTVIVPCYNGEKTLTRAVDSLLKQTMKDFEVLIINDGSKDGSGAIADAFALKDPRVRVIHKPVNEGLSAGRNTGMKEACGRYLTFLDCDDWLDPDMYRRMLEIGDGADLIVTGAWHDVWNPDGTTAVTTQDATGEDAVCDNRSDILDWAARLDEKRLFAYTWNKLYRRAFLEESCAAFEKQTLIEDFLFNCCVWKNVKRLAMVDGCYYHYVKWSNEALTQRYIPDYFQIMDRRYTSIRSLLENHGALTEPNRRILGNMHIKHIIHGLVKNCGPKAALSSKERRAVIRGLLKDPNCKEAVTNAQGKRRQEKVCNCLFAAGNVTLLQIFASLLYRMQNSKGHLFDKLK